MTVEQLEHLEQRTVELLKSYQQLQEENQKLHNTNQLLQNAYARSVEKNGQARKRLVALATVVEGKNTHDVIT